MPVPAMKRKKTKLQTFHEKAVATVKIRYMPSVKKSVLRPYLSVR